MDISSTIIILTRRCHHWLTKLSSQAQTQVTWTLATLARHILQPDLIDRPKIGDCAVYFSYVHSKQFLHTACSLLEQIFSFSFQGGLATYAHTIMELQMELSRLEAFRAVLEMDKKDSIDSELFSKLSFATSIRSNLQTICNGLRHSRGILANHKRTWVESKSQLVKRGDSVQFNAVNESFRNCVKEI